MAKYILTIGNVNGIDVQSIMSDDPNVVLKYLDDYDHEGSGITLTMDCDGEDVYKVLAMLTDDGSEDGKQ